MLILQIQSPTAGAQQQCRVCEAAALTGSLLLPLQERREIERALHDGDLWAVAATNALELGVDVGSLDVTLHLGFPGDTAAHLDCCASQP